MFRRVNIVARFIDLLAQCTAFFRAQLAGSSGLFGSDLLGRGGLSSAFFLALRLHFAARRFALFRSHFPLLLTRCGSGFTLFAPIRIGEGTHRSCREQDSYTDSRECHFHR
jgi:hypothetical protein